MGMPPHTSFQDKIDILDLIISILKDHEESLSNIADRLDVLVRNLSSVEKKIASLDKVLQDNKFTSENSRAVLVECKKWSEFKDMNVGATLVAFETTNSVLSISSASREFVFRYCEKLPAAEEVMPVHSGNAVSRKSLRLSPLSVRRWLSEELRVPEDKIIEGKLFTT